MYADIILDKIWSFFEIKREKIVSYINKKRLNITIDFKKKLFIYGGRVEFDPIELICTMESAPYKNYTDIENFFENIKEPILITGDEFIFINDAISTSIVMLDYFDLYNKKDNKIFIPNRKDLISSMGFIVDKFDNVFSSLDIHVNKEAYIHVNRYEIISGITIIGNDNILHSSPFCKNVSPINENKILKNNYNKDVVCISSDNKDLFFIPFINQKEIKLTHGFLYSLKEEFNDNLFKILKGNIIFLKKQELHEFLVNELRDVNSKKDISEYENIILALPDNQLQELLSELKIEKRNNIVSFIEDIRVKAFGDYSSLVNIRPIAKIENILNTSTDVILKHGDEYNIVDVSERNRKSFISRPDLIYLVDKTKELYSYLKTKRTDLILHSIFNEVKRRTASLPSVNKVLYDGIWKSGNKYCLITKDIKINSDILVNDGIIPAPKFIVTNYINRRTHLRNLVNKFPINYISILLDIINSIFFVPQNKIIRVKERKDAVGAINTLMGMSCFVKKISSTSINKIASKMLNNKLIFCSIINKDVNNKLVMVDHTEFIGTRKEYNVEFELKHYSSFFVFEYGHNDGREFCYNEKYKNYIDDLLFLIIETVNQETRLTNIIKDLKNRIKDKNAK